MFSLRSLVLLFPTTLISVSISKMSDALINARHLTLNTQCSKTPNPESLQHETSKHVPQMLLPQINREPNLAPKAQLFETKPRKSPGLRTTFGSPLLMIFSSVYPKQSRGEVPKGNNSSWNHCGSYKKEHGYSRVGS